MERIAAWCRNLADRFRTAPPAWRIPIVLVPLALVLVGLLWMTAERKPPRPPATQPDSAAMPPQIAPVKLLDVTPERARQINAAVPFVKGALARAPAYVRSDQGTDFERARDCMAAAAWYEAGDDPAGQRSVVQVVANRFMHPAFPKTLCGVVFQGADRSTGCQFTFACDGALDRRQPSAPAWMRAQTIAERALKGVVDPSVGLATHYHTDWVVPYWSGSLDKIARVGTHLFFRFRGFWGQRAAMRRPPGAPEPEIAKLAMLSPVHVPSGEGRFVMPKPDDADILALVARLQKQAGSGRVGARFPAPQPTDGGPNLKGNSLAVSDPARGLFGLTLDLNRAPGSYALVARTLCGERTRCTVLGWRRGSAPASVGEFRAKRGSALFSYQLTGKAQEKSLWDCREMPRPPEQCMPGTAPAEAVPNEKPY